MAQTNFAMTNTKPDILRRRFKPARINRLVAAAWLLLALLFLFCAESRGAQGETPAAGKAPATTLAATYEGKHQVLLVLFDEQQVKKEATDMRCVAGLAHDNHAIRSFKTGRYRQLKEGHSQACAR